MVTSAILRTWLVKLLAMELTLSVKSFQVPATPGTTAWPPSLPSVPTSRATRVSCHFGSKTVQLVHHVVDRVFQFETLTLHVHHNLAGQVAAGDCRGHLGDVADLVGEVAGHGVDVVGQVLPGTGHARHDSLAAQLAFGADFACYARDFRS